MDGLSTEAPGPSELARRRKLASARQERERERRTLLIHLIRTEHRARQLQQWIEVHDLFEITGSNPELKRMLDWARTQLDAFNASIEPARVSEMLRDRNLFPGTDELADPLGDPAPRRPWGR
jgi:hypothetical protein